VLRNRQQKHTANPLAFIVKNQTDNSMTKKFLLHKDKKENKENATAQMAHLVLPDTQADTSQNQKSHFLPTHRITNYKIN